MLSFLLFLIYVSDPRVSFWLQDVGSSGPQLCQATLPPTSLQPLYAALVCGVSLRSSQEKQLFVDSGLIHLMVVSGAHLAFLETLLKFGGRMLGFNSQRTQARYFILFLLGSYCFLTGFQAPVMRAFLRRLISNSSRRRLDLTGLQIEAAAIVLALLLHPPWAGSMSFLMSWMCSLALMCPAWTKRSQALDQAVKVYLFMLPFCGSSIFTIAWNLIAAPVVGLFLFPLTLLTVAAPPLVYVSDSLWRFFLAFLEEGPMVAPSGPLLPDRWLIVIPFAIHLALMLGEIRWRRESAFV